MRHKAEAPAAVSESFTTVHGWLLLGSLAIATVATILALQWYYVQQRNAIETATVRQLEAVSNTKTAQIVNWRLERIGDGHVLASTPVMRIARKILANPKTSPAERSDLLDVIQNMARSFLYSGAALVDNDGHVVLEWHDSSRASPDPWKEGLAAAKNGGVPLSELYKDPASGRILMALVVPVSGQGALILEIDAGRFLYPYLDSWPGASRTGETYLVRVDGNVMLFLSNLRYAPGSALVRRRPLAQVMSVARAPHGSLTKAIDYRGVPVIVIVRAVPESTWNLVTKMDQEEVYSPLRRLLQEMTLIIVLIALTNAAGIGLVWRNRQLRVHREREEWFQRVANDTPAYLWMVSGTEGDNFINRSLAEFLGVHDLPLRTDWIKYVHPHDADAVWKKTRECLAERREYSGEFRIRRCDGEYRVVVMHGVPRCSPQGDFLGFAGAITDITERDAAEKRLRETNKTLARELEERTRTEKQIQALSARLINAQEEERTRLARELHDDLSQQVAAVSIAMSNLKREIPEPQQTVRSHVERMQQKLAQLAESTRRISHELHPAVLQHLGLAAALRAYCAEFTSLTGIQVALATDGSFDETPAAASLCLYRIAQEALQNVAKHARVQEAVVSLDHSDGLLHLAVSDKGKGIEPGLAATGLGLISIRERVRLLGGRAEIRSEPGEGTVVAVEIPGSITENRPGS